MKASELIARLQELVKEHGDLAILVWADGFSDLADHAECYGPPERNTAGFLIE